MKRLILLLPFIVVWICCTPISPKSESTIAKPSLEKKYEITFSETLDKAKFSLELAKTFSEKARGLMYRFHLDPEKGMLFIFDEEQAQTFWMKDTHISLDLIFLDAQKKIVDIIANAKPNSVDLLTSKRPAQYVLEINGGLAQKYGIKINTSAVFSDDSLGELNK
ncbi:MAG: DUF192 domain-containing protein [bacterium]|nr:DUF192 domain-containing protein [bacterium]